MDESWVGFCVKGVWLGLAVAAPIGPVNLAMIDRGLRQGFRAAVLVGLGSTLSDLIYVLAAYAGAEPLSRREDVRLLLFGAGAVVLTWLGARAVRDAVAPAVVLAAPAGETAPAAVRGPFAAGAMIALLNPMTIASWLGILGAELAGRPRQGVFAELQFVAAVVLGLLLWIVALAAALHYGRRVVRGPMLRLVSLVAGVSLIGYGAHFALKALATPVAAAPPAGQAEVRLEPDLSGLKTRDREALARLQEAAAVMDGLHASQVRAGFHPADLTRAEFEARLEAHPELRPEFEKPNTLIRRVDGRLVAIPYEKVYLDELKTASMALGEAARLVEDAALRRFLSLRATALLSGDYYASDLAWLDLKDNTLDIVIGPIETHEDRLLGLKASYGGAVLVKDARASRSLDVYRRHLAGMAGSLPVAPGLRVVGEGEGGVLEVMNVVRFAGAFNTGIKAVAASLPTDERVVQRKGSRKQIYRNVLEAKFDAILLPIARLFLPRGELEKVTREAAVSNVLLHELAHAIGAAPGTERTAARRALRERYAALEEARADAVGLFCLHYLREQEIFTQEEVEEGHATYLAGLLRAVRSGTAQPHGQAAALQLNYLMREEAIEHDPKKGEFALHGRKFEPAIGRLAAELLEIVGRGDAARAAALLDGLGSLGPGVRESLAKAAAVPVDVTFTYSASSAPR